MFLKTENAKKYIKKQKMNKVKILLIQLVVFFGFLLLWEVLSSREIINSFLFSKPSSIIQLLKKYIISGELYTHISISVYETVLGLLIGTTLGIVIAILLWWNKTLAKVMAPFLVILNALPKTALAPIFIIWAGTGVKGIVVVAVSISLILTVLSSYNYFKNVDEEKIKMLKSFKASKFQILTKLILPANTVNLVDITKINIGMSWVGVIMGEFIVSRAGIGYLIVYGSQIFKLDLVMMGVFILAIIAYLMYQAVNILEKILKKKIGK